MSDAWIERLAWAGPVGLIAVTLLLKKARTFITSLKKKKPDEPADPTAATPDSGDPQVPPEFQYSTAPPAPPTPENPVEAYYRTHRRSLAAFETEFALANQKAQFNAVEKNTPQLLTVYDPADVREGQPLCRVEDFPFDDSRRLPTSGHPAAGMMAEEVVILDYRSLPNEMHAGFLPAHFRDRHAELVKRREDALKAGGLYGNSQDKSVARDIASSKAYSARVRVQAEKDFNDLVPEIRESAEKIARDRMLTPARVEAFTVEALARGVGVDTVADEFVKQVGDEAVQRARQRFDNPGTLNDKNPLIAALTGERMVKSGAWSF